MSEIKRSVKANDIEHFPVGTFVPDCDTCWAWFSEDLRHSISVQMRDAPHDHECDETCDGSGDLQLAIELSAALRH